MYSTKWRHCKLSFQSHYHPLDIAKYSRPPVLPMQKWHKYIDIGRNNIKIDGSEGSYSHLCYSDPWWRSKESTDII